MGHAVGERNSLAQLKCAIPAVAGDVVVLSFLGGQFRAIGEPRQPRR